MHKRLISGIVLVFILIITVLYLPRPLVAVVVSLLTGAGLWEFYRLTENKGCKPFKIYGIASGVLLVLIAYIVASTGMQLNIDEIIALLFFLIVITVLVKYSFKKEGEASVIINSGVTLLGIIYVSFLFTFIIKIRYLIDPAEGGRLVLALFIITKSADIAAYICGSKWGRHKLIPRISAKKTVEGAFFGVMGSLSAGLVCKTFTLHELGWIHTVILGVLLGIMGQIGDLVESLFKRDANVKDSGNLLGGIGGVLDLLDSLLFTGPIMYIYLKMVL